MNIRLPLILVSALVLLTGCAGAPQLAVPVAPHAFAAPSNSYGLLMTTLPAVDTAFPGAGCLLCMMAASVANSELTAYTKTLPSEDFAALKLQLADALRKKGAKVTMIDQLDINALPDSPKAAPNFARKDFTGLKAKYKVDKLLVVAISMAGIERNYASYIPAGDPKARVAGQGYIVNLNDNAREWYLPINVVKASDGKWDEPPKFPGLTNAYYQVVELTKDQLLAPLSR